MNITSQSSLISPRTLTVESLHDAARVALRGSAPLRAWRGTGRDRQEVFFYRDLVTHVAADGSAGLPALRKILLGHADPFNLQFGRWPGRHTMLIQWSHLLDAVQTAPKRRRALEEPVRYTDPSEATVPLRQ